MRQLSVASVLALLGMVGCAEPPPPAYIDATDLRKMLVSHTIYLPPTDGWPYATQLYLDPRGTGWMDQRLVPDRLPAQGDLVAVLSWQVFDPSWVCVWIAPTVSDVQSMIPPHRDCLQVFWSDATRSRLEAVATHDRRSVTTPVAISDGNTFPPSRTARYETEMRVLFGGRMPVWEVPPADLPPDRS